ncbi:MAG: hypothetical protein LBD42_02855 [Desulfovibrio sp.]|nr:hypothetical protein [Desulfovibrio sp.]
MMHAKNTRYFSSGVWLRVFCVLLLCVGLSACARTQVRGQYDVAVGGVRH